VRGRAHREQDLITIERSLKSCLRPTNGRDRDYRLGLQSVVVDAPLGLAGKREPDIVPDEAA